MMDLNEAIRKIEKDYDVDCQLFFHTKPEECEMCKLKDERIEELENKENFRDKEAIDTLNDKLFYQKKLKKILTTDNLEHAHNLAREALNTEHKQM